MQILVASDAVGMGLNLNIRRIIFHSIVKFEGAPCAAGLSGCSCLAPYSALSESRRHTLNKNTCVL